jgi:phospholipase/carboxylesterase
MRETLVDIGGLSTRVVDALDDGAKPTLAVILCHGFGATGGDLVPCGVDMIRASPKLAAAARFFFPAGPLDLSHYGMFGSRAWWMIDFEAIERAMRENSFRARLRNERPEGLEQAREQLMKLVADVQDETGLPMARIALGGFSQGAMLTLDVATQLADSPAALFQWSGTLMNEDEWRRLAPRRAGLKVIQSHGRQDPLLPYDWAESLRDMLVECGLDVEFMPFDGPHPIPASALRRAMEVLESAVAK